MLASARGIIGITFPSTDADPNLAAEQPGCAFAPGLQQIQPLNPLAR
jgi:hypothetical protein